MITGGQALLDTLNGFRTGRERVAAQSGGLGERVLRPHGSAGQTVREMTAFRDSGQGLRLGAFPKRNQDTFGRDIEDMISRKLTLEEAIKDGPFFIMTKQRLKVIQREWFEQLDRLELL